MSVRSIRPLALSVLLGLSLLGITPAPSAGATSNVLYRASWAHAGAWSSAGGNWTVSGSTLNYNGAAVSVDVAPVKAPSGPYVVEASIQFVAWKDSGISESKGFGILIRSKGPVDPGGYTAGLMAGVGRGFMGCDGVFSQAVFATADTDLQSLKQTNAGFRPGTSWHIYRVEVRGETLTLKIDGKVKNTVTTSRFATGTRVGLFSLSTQMRVKSFQVLRLH